MERIRLRTRSAQCLEDVTQQVNEAVRASGVDEGVCHLFVPHPTAGLVINENDDPDVGRDLLERLEALAPSDAPYHHYEGNAHAHIKSSLVGQSAAAAEAARLVYAAGHAVALVGAGLSVESGIPPFRGPGGLWTKYGEPDMRGFDRFREDPKRWWEERLSQSGSYQELVQALSQARPNAGHLALRELEQMGYLKHIITQNIDNLHQEAGSSAITEIHGNRTKLRCLDCLQRWPLDGFPLEELPPLCPDCGGVVKSDTVMFGEPIPRDALDECIDQSRLCDCMLLVGTSAVVYPAAGFPVDVKMNGGKLIEVNPNETPLTEACDVVLRAPAGESLSLMVERLRDLTET